MRLASILTITIAASIVVHVAACSGGEMGRGIDDDDAAGDADADVDADADSDADTDADADGAGDTGGSGDAQDDATPDAPPRGCGEPAEPDCALVCERCASIVPGAADPRMCGMACQGLSDTVVGCITSCAAEGLCEDAATCLMGTATPACEDFCEWALESCDPMMWDYLPAENCPDSCGALGLEAQECLAEAAEGTSCEIMTVATCFLGSGGSTDCPTLCDFAVNTCEVAFAGYGEMACTMACNNGMLMVTDPGCLEDALDDESCEALRACGGAFAM